ncbi:hypothetical protein [Paraoerskovia sediminicola]|uniref:hypothetical protein n=1 Tax=Paraoerskovia sediminicola TaxID=1138587 RepID=UPI002572AF6F|nr:hypothetical protein [Paraoerskovia sediminicola]
MSLPVLCVWGGLLKLGGEVVLSGAAAPFSGALISDVGPGLVVAFGIAAAVVVWGPRLAQRLAWRPLLLVAWLVSLAWTVALGASSAWSDLTAPLEHEQDYLAAVPRVAADPAGFVATLQSDPVAYPVHVRGHPPAFTLLLAELDRAGLGGSGWAAALVILAGTSTVVAVAVTLRALGGVAGAVAGAGSRASGGAGGGADVRAGSTGGPAGAGERTARLALPAVVLAPAALWVATSADAFYAGVLAWGWPCSRWRRRPRADRHVGRSPSGQGSCSGRRRSSPGGCCTWA